MTKKTHDSNSHPPETYRLHEEDSLLDDKQAAVVAENNDKNLQASAIEDQATNGDRKLITEDSSLKVESAENRAESQGWTTSLVLASISCCLGSAVPAGFHLGVMNCAADVMKDFCNSTASNNHGWNLTDYELDILWASIVSIFLVGGMLGSLYSSQAADKWGRKKALMFGNFLGVLGAISFFYIPHFGSVWMFGLARILVGVSAGFATSLVPTYMTEVAPLKLRGAVGVLCQLGLTIGVLLGQVAGLSQVLGTKESWHIMLSVFGPLCIMGFLITLMLPDTPKYLFVLKENKEEALRALSNYRNMNSMLLPTEINELEKEFAIKQSGSSWNSYKIFFDKTLRLPLILVVLMQLFQQLSGINTVFYYSGIIFKSAGLTVEQSQYATIGTGVANILMAVISFVIMPRFGRRTLLLNSCYYTAGASAVLAISCFFIDVVPFMHWICVIAVLVFVITYGIGLGPIPYFIGSELFDVGPRSTAMSLGSLFNWSGNFSVALAFPLVRNIIGAWCFLLFAYNIIILAIFCRIYLPETQGKPTSEIAASISRGFSSRPNSKRNTNL